MSEIVNDYSYHNNLPPEQRSRFRAVCYEMVNSITDAVERYDSENVRHRAKIMAHIAGLTDRSEEDRKRMFAEFKDRKFPVVITLRTFDRTDYDERKIEKNLRRFLTEGCNEQFEGARAYSPEIEPDLFYMELATLPVTDKGYSITLIRNTEHHEEDEDGTILPNKVSYLLAIDPVCERAQAIDDSTALNSVAVRA